MISFKLLIKSSVHLLLFIAYPTIDYDQLSKKEITSVVLLSPIKRLLSPTQANLVPIISSPAKFYLPVAIHLSDPFINLVGFRSDL